MFRPATDVRGLAEAPGHWLADDLIAWPASHLQVGTDPASVDWRLHWSVDGVLDPLASEPVPWSTTLLRVDPDGVPAPIAQRFPRVRDYLALRLPATAVAQAREILRCRIALTANQPSGRLVAAGGVQCPGVIDQLYAAAADAELGPRWDGDKVTLRLWAPTAREVWLLLWGQDLHAEPRRERLQPAADGTWGITGGRDWLGLRYRYEVVVYSPSHARVVANQVTDPYCRALTINSTHSVLIDLADPALAPEQWSSAVPPPLEHPVDQVIYELHLRDFSIHDSSVPDRWRGSYLAPCAADSAGMTHLRRLAAAGLNTVQLMPLFDNATVEEHPEQQLRPPKEHLKQLPPDSPEQQRLLAQVGGRSGFGWGYDPWHYFAPEGSFSSTLAGAEGAGRVTEFRSMVGAFHAAGLRVVLDQVFNHTASSGQDDKSVLDRIVPGYYHRLTPSGEVENSTCCANVATEHRMAGKLMVDACVFWVRHYRVDGFRFDLMGHHSRDNMLAVRAGLDRLTPEADGVDGRAVTLYGEGWNFGEVADDALFVQARQGRLGGTGIGTFNDRLRDAVRGGSVWDADPRGQGFGTGLLLSDNGSGANGDEPEQGDRLAWYTDLIQLGLAGGLADFRFGANSRAGRITGAELDYGGRPAGYAESPEEVINYVDAHDNETLFDALTLKLHPATPMADRVRQNTVCLALATLGQGPVLWHAGTDLLRSKSLDRNSYNSGDWFNFLDFTMRDNGFAAGLPPERENGEKWVYLAPLLADPRLKPSPDDIATAHNAALDLLRLRASTRLFRLGDPDAIRAKVSFPVSATWHQCPGVITMLIDDLADPVDPRWSAVLAVFNASAWTVHQSVSVDLSGFALHPVQAHGCDPMVTASDLGNDWVRVPGRTVAVFVRPRH